MKPDWAPAPIVKDVQSMHPDWNVPRRLIDGVAIREVKNVPKANGILTELVRTEWLDGPVGQVFQVTLQPGAISAWHAHEHATDRLFVNAGAMRVVVYDGRPGSATHGEVNEILCGLYRPTLIVVPPKLWHGVQNVSDRPSSIVNMPDRAYRYEDPDHWRLPWDSAAIPYRFEPPPGIPPPER